MFNGFIVFCNKHKNASDTLVHGNMNIAETGKLLTTALAKGLFSEDEDRNMTESEFVCHFMEFCDCSGDNQLHSRSGCMGIAAMRLLELADESAWKMQSATPDADKLQAVYMVEELAHRLRFEVPDHIMMHVATTYGAPHDLDEVRGLDMFE